MQPESPIGRELQQMPDEPLLPVERKLIGWSLGIGIALLLLLIVVTRSWFPA